MVNENEKSHEETYEETIVRVVSYIAGYIQEKRMNKGFEETKEIALLRDIAKGVGDIQKILCRKFVYNSEDLKHFF